MQSGKAQVQEAGGHAAGNQKNIFHLVNKQPSWIREERGAY